MAETRPEPVEFLDKASLDAHKGRVRELYLEGNRSLEDVRRTFADPPYSLNISYGLKHSILVHPSLLIMETGNGHLSRSYANGGILKISKVLIGLSLVVSYRNENELERKATCF